ncbi:MAG: diguanylate cyclase, partial [Deferribacterota bacterium]|nr:diguanylate cyclase [Deferribacterota bacterium]
ATDEDLIRDRLDTVKPVLINSTMEEVFERFEDNPELTILPVVDNTGSPKGVICEKSIKRYIYAPFGRELLINKSINENIRRFLTAIPTVDIKKSIEEVIEVYSQNIEAEGLIVTEDAKYKGMINPKDIINIINKKELEIAKETNPLTKLPGNILINKYISDALNKANKYRYFVYLDFNHFKPFNDNYGFRLGDRAILMCKDILFKCIDINKYFIGHIGGDDFFVGSLRDNEECLSIVKDVEKVISSFNSSILVFFDEETRKKGYYVGINRQGRKDKIQLLSISAAIIEIAKNVNNINEDVLSSVLAKSKKIAKKSENYLSVVGINSNFFNVLN